MQAHEYESPTGGRIVGILGGMGPAATARFYSALVRATPAMRDQDHLRVVIWADPTVPDRTAALLDGGPDPTPWLIDGARSLTHAGADLIAVPCNTVHAFLPAVAAASGLRTLDMVTETIRHLQAEYSGVTRVGLLASSGTIHAGLYKNALTGSGVDLLVPDAHDQEKSITAALQAVKAGDLGQRVTQRVVATAERLVRRGAQVLIEACTELPLLMTDADVTVPLLDPGEVLAKTVVDKVWTNDRLKTPGATSNT